MLVVVGSRLKAGGETGGLFRPGSCFHDLQDNGGTEDVHSCLGHLFLSYHTTTITNFVKLIGPKLTRVMSYFFKSATTVSSASFSSCWTSENFPPANLSILALASCITCSASFSLPCFQRALIRIRSDPRDWGLSCPRAGCCRSNGKVSLASFSACACSPVSSYNVAKFCNAATSCPLGPGLLTSLRRVSFCLAASPAPRRTWKRAKLRRCQVG